VFSGVEGA